MEYKYLLDIGLIIAVVKIFTILTQKIKMPKVLGGLIAGIVLGPAVLNIVQTSSILEALAKFGIILIMFLAGMETSVKKFIANSNKYVIIAITGVLVPLVLGILCSFLYVQDIKTNLFYCYLFHFFLFYAFSSNCSSSKLWLFWKLEWNKIGVMRVTSITVITTMENTSSLINCTPLAASAIMRATSPLVAMPIPIWIALFFGYPHSLAPKPFPIILLRIATAVKRKINNHTFFSNCKVVSLSPTLAKKIGENIM